MPLGVLEMASLDTLPGTSPRRTSAKAARSAHISSTSSAGGSGDVSAKAIISVFVVLGVFLVVSVVGAAVTFVETQAKDAARNHNHSTPAVEFIQFVSNDTLEQAAVQHQKSEMAHSPPLVELPKSVSAEGTKEASGHGNGNDTFSIGNILDSMAAGKDVGAAMGHL
ncbi:hypothetical protein V5799_011082 [Amblyomma americanum]|uniref:Uncharacterized protein n=1 Tax=Amblyomma americanum TaxID=6943 RepID=A0AAQ4EHV6_AMBAM